MNPNFLLTCLNYIHRVMMQNNTTDYFQVQLKPPINLTPSSFNSTSLLARPSARPSGF